MTATVPAAAPPDRPVRRARTPFGLRSVFGKTVRDSRRVLAIQLLVVAVLPMLLIKAIAGQYPTQASRQELVRLAQASGTAAQGMTGPPVNVGTVGGYLQWKYGAVFALVLAFWSVLSLTRTLAGEAASGSLDLLAAAPAGRRRIALQKIGGHLVLLAVVGAAATLTIGTAGATVGGLPGDHIPFGAAAGFAVWLCAMALAFGGLAFALGQLLGRAPAAWVAGTVLVAGPLLYNYRTLLPGVGTLGYLTPWAWTAHHLPLAGRADWAPLLPVALTGTLFLAAGIELFVRRDLDAGVRAPRRRLPLPVLGLRGAAGRSLGEQLPNALAWGLGLGAFGLLLSTASRALASDFAGSPDLTRTIHRVFPEFDISTAGGFLQLMVELLVVVAGFAAVTAVGRWSREESSRRLEVVLSAPIGRGTWALRSAAGVLAALAAMTAAISLGIGIGVGAAGSDPWTPMLGATALGLFAAAVAGIGVAVAGWTRPGAATPTATTVVVGTYLLDLLGPSLHLPGALRQLALTTHLGQPMVGSWDATGVIACAVLAVGGVGLGAAGLARRDLHS